jgi:hypothetical protein
MSFPALLARRLRGDLAGAGERLRRPRVARCGNIAELPALAHRRVPRAVFDYVEGAAGGEDRNKERLR